MSKGYLALVLHAHLPYVRHPEYDEFLEEDWLYEAITETYLPLLQPLWRMVDEGVNFQLTMSPPPPRAPPPAHPPPRAGHARSSGGAIELARRGRGRPRHDSRLNEL